MNLWPFGKKSKTNQNTSFDLPPGVMLVAPDTPDTPTVPAAETAWQFNHATTPTATPDAPPNSSEPYNLPPNPASTLAPATADLPHLFEQHHLNMVATGAPEAMPPTQPAKPIPDLDLLYGPPTPYGSPTPAPQVAADFPQSTASSPPVPPIEAIDRPSPMPTSGLFTDAPADFSTDQAVISPEQPDMAQASHHPFADLPDAAMPPMDLSAALDAPTDFSGGSTGTTPGLAASTFLDSADTFDIPMPVSFDTPTHAAPPAPQQPASHEPAIAQPTPAEADGVADAGQPVYLNTLSPDIISHEQPAPAVDDFYTLGRNSSDTLDDSMTPELMVMDWDDAHAFLHDPVQQGPQHTEAASLAPESDWMLPPLAEPTAESDINLDSTPVLTLETLDTSLTPPHHDSLWTAESGMSTPDFTEEARTLDPVLILGDTAMATDTPQAVDRAVMALNTDGSPDIPSDALSPWGEGEPDMLSPDISLPSTDPDPGMALESFASPTPGPDAFELGLDENDGFDIDPATTLADTEPEAEASFLTHMETDETGLKYDGGDIESYELGHYADPDDPDHYFILDTEANVLAVPDETPPSLQPPWPNAEDKDIVAAAAMSAPAPDAPTAIVLEPAIRPVDTPAAPQASTDTLPSPVKSALNTKHLPSPRRMRSQPEPMAPYQDSLADSLAAFEHEVLLQETRFLSNSLNNLVNQYFAQQETPPAG